eukprot:SAG11_NODE_8021_length_1069_cov_1.010309_1_plen_32_part_10
MSPLDIKVDGATILKIAYSADDDTRGPKFLMD